jgi:hypothetical protein
MLNCLTCSSPYDCSVCASTYYLNQSIVTCNPCSVGCAACNQYTPSVCTGCVSGYQLVSQTCVQVACNFSNCVYCSGAGVCQQCSKFYYWNGSQCVGGGSVSCEAGASGPLPNNCINSCSGFGFVSGNSGNVFQCKPYTSIYVYPVEYHQTYFYAYNDYPTLNAWAAASLTPTVQTNQEYAYALTNTMVITLQSVPNFYKITIRIKYAASSFAQLTLTSTTPTTTQTELLALPASSAPTGL